MAACVFGSTLRDMETNRDRGGISVLHLEINVVHPAVEREFRRIADRASTPRTTVNEMDHVAAGARLKTRRVAAEHEDRALLPVTDQTDALPDVNGLAEAIATLGNQHHACTGCFLHTIDRLLQGLGVVAHASGVRAERYSGEIHGAGIVGALWEARLCPKNAATNAGQERKNHDAKSGDCKRRK